jgi:type IV pilus assembly protein PilM
MITSPNISSIRGMLNKFSSVGAKPGSIGLDLGAEKMHMVQMEQTSEGPRIRAAVSLDYPCPREALLAQPAKFKKFINMALGRRPFKGKRVVSCLPATEIDILFLSFKQLDGQSVNDAIVRELRERVKDKLDDSVIDFLSIRDDNNQHGEKHAIVAIAPKKRVMDYLGLLQQAGLEPVALDIGPAALGRLVSNLPSNKTHPNVLLVNFGRDKSYLSVIWGKRLMLDREIDFGESRLIARLCKSLNILEEMAYKLLYEQGMHSQNSLAGESDFARTLTEVLRPEFAALADEINKTLIYTASVTRGSSVEQSYLLGSVARYPQVASFMQNLLSVPVEVLNPFNSFTSNKNAALQTELDPIAGIALASGLCLRGMTDG